MAISYKKSKSDQYSVTLNKAYRHRGFLYIPGREITLNEATLIEFITAEVIATVSPTE